MEYLMTYGWAILIIAIVVGVLFALGLFNGSAATPNGCSPQPGFTCSNPIYTPNGITATISQDSGQNYYDAFVFVASESENIGPGGLPVNFSESNTVNMTPIGTIPPSGTVTFNFNHTAAGGIPTANIPVGTEFTGYIWIAYCLSPVCPTPTNFAKVGSISAKETGVSTFTGGGSSTSITSTSSTSTSTTSTSTTSIPYVQITLTNTNGAQTPNGFQQMISFNPSQYPSNVESSNLGNIRFYSGNAITGSGPLYSWCETNCSSSSSSNAIFWVNLGSEVVPAGGSLVINMTFDSPNVNYDADYAGEAPTQSCSNPSNPSSCTSITYGEYDNGKNVFPTLYQNWKSGGPSPPGGWVLNSDPININDGLTLSPGNCYTPCGLYNDTGISMGSVTLDMYEYFTNLNVGGNNNDQTGYYGSQGSANQYLITAYGNTYDANNHDACGCGGQDMAFNYGSTSTPSVWSIAVSGSQTEMSYDYNVQTLDDINYFWGNSTGYVGFLADANSAAGNIVQYWIRIRNDPAGFTMPGVSYNNGNV